MDDGDDVYSGSDIADRAFWGEERDEPPALDWSHCPCCGATEDFGVHSEARIFANNHLSIAVDGGRLVTATWGFTEPDYTSSVTRAHYADCCGEELPKAYQDALDDRAYAPVNHVGFCHHLPLSDRRACPSCRRLGGRCSSEPDRAVRAADSIIIDAGSRTPERRPGPRKGVTRA